MLYALFMCVWRCVVYVWSCLVCCLTVWCKLIWFILMCWLLCVVCVSLASVCVFVVMMWRVSYVFWFEWKYLFRV